MNKFSGWRAGRMDAVSYDGDGDGPYKQVYVDNPEGRMHLGERLPDVVVKAYGVQGADCREVALLVAAAPDLLEAVRHVVRAYDFHGDCLRSNGLQMCRDALAKAEPPDAKEG